MTRALTMSDFLASENFSDCAAAYEIYDLQAEMKEECVDYDEKTAQELLEKAAEEWRQSTPGILH